MSEKFNGFPRATGFFRTLEHNNNREWFNAHKQNYLEAVEAPAQSFVEALGARLKSIYPKINAVPGGVSGSVMRIYRDVRFSKDKSPYKTNLGIVFWEGDGKKTDCPGFYFHLDKDGSAFYFGQYFFPPSVLPAYREAVDNSKFGPELEKILAAVAKVGDYKSAGEEYKRVPSEYSADHKRADLLRRKGVMFRAPDFPAEVVASPKLVDACFEQAKIALPLHKWLVKLNQRAAG